MEIVTIVTDRLLLRSMQQADISSIFSILSNDVVAEYTAFNTCHDLRDAEKIFSRMRQSCESNNLLVWGICRRNEESLIGMIGFANWKEPLDTCAMAKIWYNLREDCWNQGIIAEAIQPVIHWGFTGLSLETITASVVDGNERSHRVVRKAGFQEKLAANEMFKGRLCTMTLYTLSKNDFFPKL
ncbi:MAG: GNAT family N-acetyltransferase [Chitinivibrionales bacterium]|nr:GNAT family N-acetyltransferase [Chitinivibrionales bacterium]